MTTRNTTTAVVTGSLYGRRDIISIPIRDIPPANLVLAWRADDHRDVVRDITDLMPPRDREG